VCWILSGLSLHESLQLRNFFILRAYFLDCDSRLRQSAARLFFAGLPSPLLGDFRVTFRVLVGRLRRVLGMPGIENPGSATFSYYSFSLHIPGYSATASPHFYVSSGCLLQFLEGDTFCVNLGVSTQWEAFLLILTLAPSSSRSPFS
jgi:hypothetical protein